MEGKSATSGPPPPRLFYLSGFEGTQMFGHGIDVLDTSQHTGRYAADLLQLVTDGITEFRCCIPWHKIERVRGSYDWSWTDRYLDQVRRLGLRPIVDPLHHTSFPHWLENGFANPDFPHRYVAFLTSFARRYPWVSDYTIINEPVATSILCGFTGDWYPHWTGRGGVAQMILGMVRAIHAASIALENLVPALRIVHVDTCERHHALDEAAKDHTEFSNHLRFAVLDLLLGRVAADHPLFELFSRNGLREDELALYRALPSRIDVLGLDYYAHSEMGWTRKGPSEAFRPFGFRKLAKEYAARYPFNLMLSETNVRGRIEDRLTWLRYMVSECEQLTLELMAQGRQFEGFCWYPHIDSTDWCSLCREPNGRIDPQGIYHLTGQFDRMPSELSETYVQLAAGKIEASQIPAYRLENPVLTDRRVGKFLCHMAGFEWREGQPSGAPYACQSPLTLADI
ncbi:hypothetical protein [Pseudotabrizicola algicola]|uniref:hypothetical protein n=1 Tax=Pseudotabrizicola algicola TaxID=2709381 RepID=UPI0013E0A29A|nr:hypothetical protein [Pseudotabrizicola algicola]